MASAAAPQQQITYVDDEAGKSLGAIAEHVSLATNEKTGIPSIQPEIEKEVLKPAAEPVEKVEHERPAWWYRFLPGFQKKTVFTTEANKALEEKIDMVEDKSGGAVKLNGS